jgi:heterodisulfide reductase subunit C
VARAKSDTGTRKPAAGAKGGGGKKKAAPKTKAKAKTKPKAGVKPKPKAGAKAKPKSATKPRAAVESERPPDAAGVRASTRAEATSEPASATPTSTASVPRSAEIHITVVKEKAGPGGPGKPSGTGGTQEPVKIDHRFREKLGIILEGDGVNYCYQCGACVGDCPTARFAEEFNPRNIMLAVLYGMEDELVGPNSPIWMCSNCFTCYDRCPQDVKPIEIIIALKNYMGQQGIIPEGVEQMTQGIVKTGRSTIVSKLTERRRNELGLPPLGEIPVDEITAILEE